MYIYILCAVNSRPIKGNKPITVNLILTLKSTHVHVVLCSFVVTNGESSRSGVLHLTVLHVDRVPPTLRRNNGLRLQGGASEPITSQQLQLSDPDTASANLSFRLTEAPRHGHLQLGGTPLAPPLSFTQDHLDKQELVYQHQSSSLETSDSFSFLPSDGTNAGYLHFGQLKEEPQVFHIQVSPHLKERCTIKDQATFFSSHQNPSPQPQSEVWETSRVDLWTKVGVGGGCQVCHTVTRRSSVLLSRPCWTLKER